MPNEKPKPPFTFTSRVHDLLPPPSFRKRNRKRKRTFMIDPLSYIVVIICKTLQHVIGCLLVWMIFAMAIGRK